MSKSEMGELFDAWHEHKREKKAANLENSTDILREKGVVFEEKNSGVHLVVQSSKGIIDFWPSTGKWIARKSNKNGRGVFNLLKYIGVDCAIRE